MQTKDAETDIELEVELAMAGIDSEYEALVASSLVSR